MRDFDPSFQVPFSIEKIMQDYSHPWAIAGGWAIDLFLNTVTREHQDIEIAIPRKDQLRIKSYLTDWDLQFITSGTFNHWPADHFLELPIHEIHGFQEDGNRLEILLNEFDGGIWKFRRNLSIQYATESVVITSSSGLPILSPEVVLLYKSKWLEPKDQSDFQYTLPLLSANQKKWLKAALITQYTQHEWLRFL